MGKLFLMISLNRNHLNRAFALNRDNCFCDDSYGRYGAAPETECNMACDGNSSQICGGWYRNSIYVV